MGRIADPQDLIRPDYVEETRKIGERFNLWHRITEQVRTSDARRLRRLWEMAGRLSDMQALSELHKKVREKKK